MIVTPEIFAKWLADLKTSGIASSAREAAPLLGVSENAISAMRRKGVTGDAAYRTAMTMTGILEGNKPYGQTPEA